MSISEMPPSWKATLAAVAGALLGFGWAEGRMERVAQAAVMPTAADLREHKALGEVYLKQLREDAARTRLIAESLLADCHARGGCK